MTYVAKWDFNIGNVTGQLKPSFILGIVAFVYSFTYNMIDEENA